MVEKVTCKDCIHYDVCQHSRSAGEHFEINVEKFGCKLFKDKSRFIELPCNVGDKYYTVDKYCTENGYYDIYKISYTSDCEYCEVQQCDKQYRITEHKFYNVIRILQCEPHIGKTVFLTREEAEKALKERERK